MTLKQTQKQIYMYIYNVLRMYIKQFADMDTIFFLKNIKEHKF